MKKFSITFLLLVVGLSTANTYPYVSYGVPPPTTYYNVHYPSQFENPFHLFSLQHVYDPYRGYGIKGSHFMNMPYGQNPYIYPYSTMNPFMGHGMGPISMGYPGMPNMYFPQMSYVSGDPGFNWNRTPQMAGGIVPVTQPQPQANNGAPIQNTPTTQPENASPENGMAI